MSKFWNWFDLEIKPKLGVRASTFEAIFRYLDEFNRPVCILETGCTRQLNNWEGDGCSTVIFDKYVQENKGLAFSVDVNSEATGLCRSLVTRNTSVITSDSVEFLKNFDKSPDLLYLDSFDLDVTKPLASEIHHINELKAIMPQLRDDTLVVIDDSMLSINEFGCPEVTGKGSLVAKHALEVGADMLFCKYQIGWTGMKQKDFNPGESLKELVLRARAYVETDKIINASNLYRLILQLTNKPQTGLEHITNGEACAFFARIAISKDRLGSAIDWYSRALRVDPKAVDYRLELATKVLRPLGNMDAGRREALAASRLEPDNPQVWHILGGFEHSFNNEVAALEHYEKELELAPDDPFSMLDVISILLDQPDYKKSRELALKVLETPQKGEGYYCLGFIAYRESRHEEAIELFDKALKFGVSQPATLHWSKSLALHSIGRYKEGWVEHKWRSLEMTHPAIRVPMVRFSLPLWNNEPPPARIHIHAEAGRGDNLCCVRYLKLLVDNGYDVRYEAYAEMASLIQRSFPDVKVIIQAPDYPGSIGVEPFDYHYPVGGLPGPLETDIDTVPWFGPYLKPDPDLVKNYRDISLRGKKIGLCWSAGIRKGSWLNKYGQRKSMHFSTLEPLFKVRNGSEFPEFISLQVGPERDQNPGSALDILPEKPDWDDTAALVENLDLVITVDTAVAHLAGAMGKPVWVLCQRDGQSWHWMCYREGASWNEKSPWYPSARVFRQHRFNEPHFWDEVIEDVAKELTKWLD